MTNASAPTRAVVPLKTERPRVLVYSNPYLVSEVDRPRRSPVVRGLLAIFCVSAATVFAALALRWPKLTPAVSAERYFSSATVQRQPEHPLPSVRAPVVATTTITVPLKSVESPDLRAADHRVVETGILQAARSLLPESAKIRQSPSLPPPPVLAIADSRSLPTVPAFSVPAAVAPPPALQTGEADARDVLSALQSYSDAWAAKAAGRIAALRPDMDRRTLKAELAGLSSIRMYIRPLGPPKLEGDRAIVECSDQVDQVFIDGMEKHSPPVKMTYTLVKRNGSWLIAGLR